jgi:plasmid stabilization system protein ParE
MSWTVHHSPDVDRDVDAIIDWYEERAPEQAQRFLDSMQTLRLAVGDNPRIFRARRGNWRMAQVPGFPYSFWYTVQERSHSVFVAAVVHQSRNPKLVAGRTHTR